MAKVKLTLDTRYKNISGKYPLTIQLSHGVKTRFIKIDITLTQEQWEKMRAEMSSRGKIQRMTSKALHRLTIATKYIEDHELDIRYIEIDQLKRNLEVLLKKNESTSSIVLQKASVGRAIEGTLENWGSVLIKGAKQEKRIGTAHWYKFAIDEFKMFNRDKDIYLIDINESFLEDFKV